MSQARIATGMTLGGRIFSILLLFGLAVIWHSGDGARSQGASDAGGMASVAIHPDEGLRQAVHFLQKRVDDRGSGALPDPVVLAGLSAPPKRGAPALQPVARAAAPIAKAAPKGRFARAPPLHML